MTRFMGALLDFVFPPLCHLCRRHIPRAGRLHLCPDCRELLVEPSRPLCTICGAPFAGAGEDHPCSACLTHPPPFDAARAAMVHDGPGRSLIHSFKYDFRTHLRRPLAFLMAERLTGFVTLHRPDLIVPVPLHVRRLRSRGFNQALLLAELLAREWRVALVRHPLKRVRWTEPQITLAADLRRANVKGAFQVPDADVVGGKNLLLVDDVFTTGSTVAECARVLKKAGAGRVLVVTVSRAAG